MSENNASVARVRNMVIRIVLIALAALLLLYGVLVLIEWLMKKDTPGVLPPKLEHWPVDDSFDVFSDGEYMEYDRRVHYYDPNSGATYSVEEEDVATLDAGIRLFYYYFQAAIAGDEQAYSNCFTEKYQKSGKLPEDFTMQMIYDIRVAPEESFDENTLAFRVEYKIRKNNGTLRDDMESDVSRAQIFTLVPNGYEYLIDNIVLYTSFQ